MSDPRPQPVVILVEPQLAENIGMAARAMANFGLSRMRLVAPRNGWPKKGAHAAASGAAHVLERAELFPTAAAAMADLSFVLATTAREREQMKRVYGPEEAMAEAGRRVSQGHEVGILFGRERVGLTNDEVALADAILTFPVDPGFSSVNLAQSVLLVAYEWHRAKSGGALPFQGGLRSKPARRESLVSLFEAVEGELDGLGFYPEDKRAAMTRNMRDILLRMEMTEQDVRTIRGIVRALGRDRHQPPR